MAACGVTRTRALACGRIVGLVRVELAPRTRWLAGPRVSVATWRLAALRLALSACDGVLRLDGALIRAGVALLLGGERHQSRASAVQKPGAWVHGTAWSLTWRVSAPTLGEYVF